MPSLPFVPHDPQVNALMSSRSLFAGHKDVLQEGMEDEAHSPNPGGCLSSRVGESQG